MNQKGNKYLIKTLPWIVILALIAQFLLPVTVYAQDGTTPETTPDIPIVTEIAPPAADPTLTDVATEGVPTVETTPIATETLTEVPEGTDLVVLDSGGDEVALTTQDAAKIIIKVDPMWCPDGSLPNDPGCTTNMTIEELLADMRTNPEKYAANGIIYFDNTAPITSSFVLDETETSLGTAYNLLNPFNLALSGGWNGGASSTFEGSTIFEGSNGFMSIGSSTNPWLGSLTLNNLTFLNVISPTTPPLEVNSTGSVKMDNVKVDGSGEGQNGIEINASDVELTDVSALNANSNGITINAVKPGNVTLNNVIAQGNGSLTGTVPTGSGILINGNNTNVSVNGGSFTNNSLYGIEAVNSISSTIPLGNVWTDASDYAPGSVVTVSGGDNALNGANLGFTPGESVNLNVFGPNGYFATCNATADAFGKWDCPVELWASEQAVGNYFYTANGITSKTTVSGTFTDARATTTVITNSGSLATNSIVGQSYQVDFSVTSTLGTPFGIVTVSDGSSTCSVIITSGVGHCHLTSNTPGAKTITATFSANLVYSGSVSAGVPHTAYCSGIYSLTNTCGAPTNLSASGISQTQIDLSWTDNSNDEIRFMVERSDNGISGWSEIGFNWLNDSTYSDTGLSCGQTYYYKVRARTLLFIYSDYSNIASAATSPCPDRTPPVIAPHSDVTAEATSSAGAIVTYTSPATSDNVDTAGTATCALDSGNQFALGDTTVYCNATDAAGNHAVQTSFVVHVVDTTPPVIEPHADVTTEATSALGAIVTYTNPATSDIVDPSGLATCAPASDSQFALGDTSVHCDATDFAGNHAIQTSFVVHVVDTTPPVSLITDGPNNPTIQTAAYFDFYSTDAVGVDHEECRLDSLVWTDCSSGFGDPSVSLGDHWFYVRAIDKAGNVGDAVEFTWLVVENLFPNTGGPNPIIPVTGGQMVDLSCQVANTLELLPNVKVTFTRILCGYQASLEEIKSDSPLPSPITGSFGTGLILNLFQGGPALQTLPAGASALLSLKVPEGASGTPVILFWDPLAKSGAGTWVELPSAAGPIAAGDTRMVTIAQSTVAGMLQIGVNFTGTFVLVNK